MGDNQDLRKYGGLISFLPLSYSVILIASLSLVAFPFLSGYYSKDFILESAFGQYTFSSVSVYFIATIGAIFTTLYSVKILYLTFLSPALGSKVHYFGAVNGESNIFMSLPLVILALFSIFFGYITRDIFLGMGTNFFADNAVFIYPSSELIIETEFAVPTLFKLLPFFCTVFFSFVAIVVSEWVNNSIIDFKFTRFGYNLFGFFNQKFLIEMFYNNYIVNSILAFGGQTTRVLDKGCIELMGPRGLEEKLILSSKNIGTMLGSSLLNYALFIAMGFIIYMFTIKLGGISNLSLIVLALLFSVSSFK